MKRILELAVLLLGLASCSKERHVDIEVSERHLDQLPSGEWLAAFEISWKPDSEDPKRQILQKLRGEGTLRNEFRQEINGNDVITRVWNYRGHVIKEQYFQGGIWRGPEVIAYQEYYQGELPVWITIEFPEGIPYSKLLPDQYKYINASRKHEHTATINCKGDRARLFLFGFGSLCQRISFF
jgi:hypothetical protein